jgi:putative glutamine amidotransferase
VHPRLVAVTATTRETDGVERLRLNQSYVHALESAGLIPLVIPPLADLRMADHVLDTVHGLVLTGGEDVDPARYGVSRHAETYPSHGRRDDFELALCTAAQRARVPTLAICRGIQIANVALGGTLVQHIPSDVPNALSHDGHKARDERVHQVRVTPDAKLAIALRATTLQVNSSHHQSIDRIGNGLRVTATAPDGIIEGIEWPEYDWWMLGVQWHPEELVDTAEPWDRNLFAAFAAACGSQLPAPSSLSAQRSALSASS